jgi:hypothetical protein
VELLTIRIRLIVCSLDKAREIGLDWWMYDRHLSPGLTGTVERHQLEQRIEALERQLGVGSATASPPAARPPTARRTQGRPGPKGAPRARPSRGSR